jgi:hypothetical protein
MQAAHLNKETPLKITRWSAVALSALVASAGLLIVAPAATALPDPTFSASPTTGVIGDTISVASVTACPAPEGAGDWVAIVNVAQGSDDQVSFENFLVAGDGSWSGTITLPAGLVTGDATLTAACFDATHDVDAEVDYTDIPITIVEATTTTSSTTTVAPASTTTTAATAPSTTAAAAAQAVTATPAFTG